MNALFNVLFTKNPKKEVSHFPQKY